MRRITGVGASLMILTSLAVASPPAASAAESDLIKLEDTNIELLEQLSPEDHCLWNKTVYPAGGTGYADNSLPYDGMDATKAAVLVVRAEALRDNMGSVVGVEAIGQGEVSSLQILVDEASADARTSADLLSKSP
ncbi:hypothetical protein [Pseudoclavibacter sp. VKM Ac-2888]|uniref:hypothetical protein n=1 Tax=Pseudoclavibacter sp. VKM Ac-2888 TaxID=2783830 RepID=UPI00188CA407|nr:hypothetical protein [Pseudoclavibacter sp. VKM Ac-2888]MBF4552392.1 hypothetical protein [Pseudoclavibacter sp. VKM Ac-2888]